jgi:hypothetical protein
MTLWYASPPQGNTSEESLSIIRRLFPKFGAPQGIAQVVPLPVEGALVQTETLSALVQTGTLSALIQTGSP